MAKRVFEIAKELGVDSKAIIAKCHAEGIPESAIKNHMSPVGPGLQATIKEWFSDGGGGTAVETAEKVDVESVKVKPRRASRGKRPIQEDDAAAEASNKRGVGRGHRTPAVEAEPLAETGEEFGPASQQPVEPGRRSPVPSRPELKPTPAEPVSALRRAAHQTPMEPRAGLDEPAAIIEPPHAATPAAPARPESRPVRGSRSRSRR